MAKQPSNVTTDHATAIRSVLPYIVEVWQKRPPDVLETACTVIRPADHCWLGWSHWWHVF